MAVLEKTVRIYRRTLEEVFAFCLDGANFPGFFIACSSITIMFCVQRVCTPATGSTPCNAGPRSLSHPRLALVRGVHGLA